MVEGCLDGVEVVAAYPPPRLPAGHLGGARLRQLVADPLAKRAVDDGRRHAQQAILSHRGRNDDPALADPGSVASNGEIVATSEAYESKSGAENGIEGVRRAAATAEVVDETESS